MDGWTDPNCRKLYYWSLSSLITINHKFIDKKVVATFEIYLIVVYNCKLGCLTVK